MFLVLVCVVSGHKTEDLFSVIFGSFSIAGFAFEISIYELST
jgi:hypothetical protein